MEISNHQVNHSHLSMTSIIVIFLHLGDSIMPDEKAFVQPEYCQFAVSMTGNELLFYDKHVCSHYFEMI